MMTMYSRIVVPYDHSDLGKKALKYAVNLAKQDEKIDLYVVTVIQPEIPTLYRYPRLREAQLEAAEEIRDGVEQDLKRLPNKTRIFVLEGDPPQLIVEFVDEHNADLIVMGSRGLSDLKEAFLGSVSHYVVQRATCPVLIVK